MVLDMETTTKGSDMNHTIKILANLNSGDMIVRSTFRGVTRMTQTELEAHRSCGCLIEGRGQ